ncbi:MAG: hypothetical protein M0Z32_00155 [Actinomycetota bacterium]|nr:zinc ribbon domain-containing protein [Actinomycetota bacterium]MCL6093571.1 zinc ribbon domain-containing protein [Actinomycetota bacterium]MDA8166161.1 hypothetical protein [Actinomycetota bacterium]
MTKIVMDSISEDKGPVRVHNKFSENLSFFKIISVESFGITDRRACPCCKRESFFDLVQIKKWISFSFIPLFAYQNKYFEICSLCKNGEVKSGIELTKLKEYIAINNRALPGPPSSPPDENGIYLRHPVPESILNAVRDFKNKDDYFAWAERATRIHQARVKEYDRRYLMRKVWASDLHAVFLPSSSSVDVEQLRIELDLGEKARRKAEASGGTFADWLLAIGQELDSRH